MGLMNFISLEMERFLDPAMAERVPASRTNELAPAAQAQQKRARGWVTECAAQQTRASMMVVRVPPWVAAALQSADAFKIRAEYSGRFMQDFSMQPRWHLLPHPAGQPTKMSLSFCGSEA